MSKKTQEMISQVCDEVKDFLILKNESYGDSAINPIGIFSDGDPISLINCRLDDKISRLKRGKNYGDEDTEYDLLGYLILKQVILRMQKEEMPPSEKMWKTPPPTTALFEDGGTEDISGEF